MQALRKEFVSLEDQTASFLKPIVESAFRSAGELTEAQKGLSGLKASSEAIQQQSKRLAQKLRFFMPITRMLWQRVVSRALLLILYEKTQSPEILVS